MEPLGLEQRYVYGPITSRRLGRSLGLNISPTKVKHCSFGCIYCERGITQVFAGSPQDSPDLMPPADEILRELRDWLEHHAQSGEQIDVITFAGNGEPTDHPDFEAITRGVMALRDELMPSAEIALLSNSHNVSDPEVRRVIGLFDQRCMKLDAGEERLWKRINVPFRVSLDEVVEGLRHLEEITIQTMIIQGRADNSGEEAVRALVGRLRQIQPAQVHLYTLDRAAALEGVERVPRERLEEIATEIREGVGVPVEVFG